MPTIYEVVAIAFKLIHVGGHWLKRYVNGFPLCLFFFFFYEVYVNQTLISLALRR